MTTYLEVGARLHGRWVTSREELVSAVASGNPDLEFWPTRTMNTLIGQHASLQDEELFRRGVAGLVLEVVGPNPWISRFWRTEVFWVYSMTEHTYLPVVTGTTPPLRRAS